MQVHTIRVLHLVSSWTLPLTSCYRSKDVRRSSLGGRRRLVVPSLGGMVVSTLGKRRVVVPALGGRRKVVVPALGGRRRLVVSTLGGRRRRRLVVPAL